LTGAEVEFDLSVTSPTRASYPATIKQYLPPAVVTGIPVGTEVPVKIDPDDPGNVLIWGGLPSAGASPAPGLPVVTAGPSGGSVPPTPTLRDSRQGAMSEQQFELEQLRASDEERLHATPHHGALRRLRVGAAVVLLMACLGVGLAVVLTTVPKLHGSRLAATVTPVPGSRDVPLAVGSYVVYYEADSPGDIGLSPPRVRVRIGSPSGRPLPLKRYGGNFHTGSSYVDARAIFTVEVPTPGTYRISATGELSQPGFSDPRIVLGMPFGSKVLKIVGGGLLALFAFIGLTFFLQRVLEGVRSR
jgi:hypothetical protein